MAEGHPHGIIHEERDSVDGHHVHFPEDISANTEIQLQMKGASLVNAHLGFLQHKHKYEVQLKLPVSPTSNSLTPVINTPFIAVGSVKSLAVPSDNENDKSKDERALERWDLDQLIMHSTTIHCTRKNRMYILSTVIFEEDGKGHEVILELDAHKEGLLRDKFLLRNEDDKEFVIVLHARVLGLRKGTPMLKEGIRCIHFEKDDEEDHSDWQGFE